MDWAESDYKRGLITIDQYGYLLRADMELDGFCRHLGEDIIVIEGFPGVLEEHCKGCGIVLGFHRIDETPTSG